MSHEEQKIPVSQATETSAEAAPDKKSSSWDWLWPSIVAIIIVKVFGVVGGLISFGCYYWLKPKLGTWGAVAASGVIGMVVAIGFLALIRS
jgi:hypothetical protein